MKLLPYPQIGFGFWASKMRLLDRPLEPVIGRRFAPTRWRTMTPRRSFGSRARRRHRRVRPSAASGHILRS
jgi:hypothetical protein